MADPSELATAATGGGVAGAGALGLLQWLAGRALRRGDAAETKLEDRIEGGLGDHKEKLDDLVPRAKALEARLEGLERDRDWLRAELLKVVGEVGELRGRLAGGGR